MILLWLNVNALSTTFYCCNVSSLTLSTLDLVHKFLESFDKAFFCFRIHNSTHPHAVYLTNCFYPSHKSASTSTSTSTLFTKKSNYNRLARKIAIANLGGPVKRKNKVNGEERKKNISSFNNSYFYHSFILITLHLRKNQKGIDGEKKAFNFMQKSLNC